jgi:hypothetical protein
MISSLQKRGQPYSMQMVSSMTQKERLKSSNAIKFFYNCNRISISDKSCTHPGFPELTFKSKREVDYGKK